MEIHGTYRSDRPARWTTVSAHAVAVGVASAVLLSAGHGPRTIALLSCATIYFVRTCGTLILFLRRSVSWPEAASVGGLVLVVHPLFAWFGRYAVPVLDGRDALALGLYVAGSALNTGSEAMRHHWKADPTHVGQLYTGGPFRWIRHPNYLGDALLFTGYAWLTDSRWAFLVPAAMLGGFLFVSIPDLDRYLAGRYRATYSRGNHAGDRYREGLARFFDQLCKRYGVNSGSRSMRDDADDDPSMLESPHATSEQLDLSLTTGTIQ